jgi:hypothetical protein
VNQVHVFVSFDVDHDNDCKDRLLSQVTPAGSHFAIDDWSIREIATDWQDKTTKRISNVDVLLVICGEHADTAHNVNYEIAVAREQNKPYLLLDGRPGRSTKPTTALETDQILDWSPHTLWSPVDAAQHRTAR